MLAQLVWLGAGVIIGSQAASKARNYLDTNFKDEIEALEKADKAVAQARKDLGEAMKAKWSGTLVVDDEVPGLDALLKKFNKPTKDNTVTYIMNGISKAINEVDWDLLKKETDQRLEEVFTKLKKEKDNCCGGAKNDCCK